ncbi:hypothetical protein AMTR_s00067p00044530, partial [Amborella trichopoda]
LKRLKCWINMWLLSISAPFKNACLRVTQIPGKVFSRASPPIGPRCLWAYPCMNANQDINGEEPLSTLLPYSIGKVSINEVPIQYPCFEDLDIGPSIQHNTVLSVTAPEKNVE